MRPFRTLICAATLMVAATSSPAQLLSPDSQRQSTGTNSSTGSRNNAQQNGNQTTTTERVQGQFQSVDTDQPTTQSNNIFGTQRTDDQWDVNGQQRRQQFDASGRLIKPRSTEFSRYATKLVGQPLHVFGADFFIRSKAVNAMGFGPVTGAPAVPPEYLVNAGDEILIQISGAYEAEFKQQVRRGGDITLPRVGTMRVAGVTAGELSNAIRTRLESQFRNIQVSASFVSLRGMRVFVTGFVDQPGAHTVDSISTITSAIAAAGGPTEGGSYRQAELWRKGKRLASFDLYEFLVKGDSSKDLTITADDVIRVAPASSFQVALTGSVNRPGVYELLPGETMQELLQYAGGYTPVAERDRVAALEIDSAGRRQLVDKRGTAARTAPLTAGAVLHVFSSASMTQGINSTLKIVHVEGEVKNPGSYVLPANSTVQDAVAAAGGMTSDAFPQGLALVRPSLAQEQSLLLNRSLDELERSVFEATTNMSAQVGEAGQGALAAGVATRTYIERLRQFKPTGRLIVAKSEGTRTPQPLLLDGDKISVPPKPVAVSVFGAVYGEGSYMTTSPAPLADFLRASGGLRPGADESSIVILKADGSYLAPQRGWLSSTNTGMVEPGDSIFVPTDTEKGKFWAIAKDVGTLLYQFGLGAAAIKALN